MQHEYTLPVKTARGEEEIAILQHSVGDHQFIAWHGINSVNRFWYWDCFWPVGQVNLVGLPGHGPVRYHPPSRYAQWTPQHFIETGIEVADYLYKGDPVTLIGHSIGGLVALGVALQAPARVARLILLSPVVWHNLGGIVGGWVRLARRPRLLRLAVSASLLPTYWALPIFRQSLRVYVANSAGFYGNAKLDPTLQAGYKDYRHTPVEAIMGTVKVLREADLRPLLQQSPLPTPTLIVHGAKDSIVPLQQSRWLHNQLPNSHLAVIPGAGHVAYAEREETVMAQIMAWCEHYPPEG